MGDPLAPRRIARIDTPGSSWRVAVDGDTVLVADWEGGVRVIDIARPEDPIEVAAVTEVGISRDVSLIGDLAVVAQDAHGLLLLDLSQPSTPEIMAHFDTPDAAYGVDGTNGRVYVADRLGGLFVLTLDIHKVLR
ncbi:MAG: hypothetical protein R2873_04400 [Caldilineaceae bacterium]